MSNLCRETCQNLCDIQRKIDNGDQRIQDADNCLATVSDLINTQPAYIFSKAVSIESSGPLEATECDSQANQEKIADLLKHHPQIAKSYQKLIAIIVGQRDAAERVQKRLETKCTRGPIERRQCILFGRKIMQCRSKALVSRFNMPLYTDKN